MSKKKDEEADKWAYLLKPAKDLTDNFSIDLLTYLNDYLNVIRHRDEEDVDMSFDAESNYKIFNFAQACMVLQGSATVYAKKVDYILEEVYGLVNMIENSKGDDQVGGNGRKGRRKKVDIGSSSFEIIDMKSVTSDIAKSLSKTEKEEKRAIDNLRLVDNAEISEAQYERKHVRAIKPTQFIFGKNSDQLMRTDEQVYNSKSRPEIIGKVRDFDLKKSVINHDSQILVGHDSYQRNVSQFTLPGAKWIPDNKELAAHFGVADIEVELDLEKKRERVSLYGPFKDPLSGREIVAPPKWYIEQEAVKQQNERAASTINNRGSGTISGMRDSQGLGSQATRMSQPLIERQRNSLNQFVSFVEGRMNKNRASTHLNTDLVDMVVDNFGDTGRNMPFATNDNYDMDDDYGGVDNDNENEGYEQDDNVEDDYIEGLKKNKERRPPPPWDDIESDPMRGLTYDGHDEYHVGNKEIKIIEKDPTTSLVLLMRKNKKEEKKGMSRQDNFMQTHDYLQNQYYWRSAARINPNKDWKIEALRMSILKEQKRRAKERTMKIREARLERDKTQKTSNRRRGARITLEEFDMAVENDFDGNTVEEGEAKKEAQTRRTLGTEYDDVADEDLAAEVELSMLGANYDDDEEEVMPRGEMQLPVPDLMDIGPQSVSINFGTEIRHGLRFDAIDDAELATIVNLPGDLFMTKAIPMLKKFAESRSDREQMAYEMAKACDIGYDVATSTLQAQVDEWNEKLDPALEEGETRKEYEVHTYGSYVLDQFDEEGESKSIEELVIGKPWYEISRYFLSCLLMSNTKNVRVTEDKSVDVVNRINTMTISLLSKKRHHEVFEQDGAL